MNPIQITLIGHLGEDPRTFTTSDGTAGLELRLALDLPRPGGEPMTRWVKVNAYGVLASRTAASVSKGDRVVVQADDVRVEAWLSKGEPRAIVVLRASDIAASMRYDSLTTGRAHRRAGRAAAANGDPNGLPAREQAEARVLAGVIAASS